MSFLNRLRSGWRNPHYVRGMRYYNRCEFSKALEEFQILLRGGRGRSLDRELARFYAAEAHTKLGLDHYRQRDFSRAKVEFRAALEVEGSFPDLYYYLGSLAYREGNLAEARSLLDRTLELNPMHRQALACRALVHRAERNEGLARDDLMRLVSSGFPMPEITARQPQPAVRASMLVSGKNRLPDPHLIRALDAYDRGRYGETLAALGDAIDAHPGYADLRFRQGQLLIEMNRLHEAVASFDSALRINPDFVDACLSRGVCLLALNRPDKAERSLDHAASRQPEYADVAFYHGVALSRMGKLQEALSPLSRALDVNPMFWRAHFVAGQIQASLGELHRGFDSLGLALTHQTPEPRDWETSGRPTGHRAGAVARLEEAVAMHPRYADLHYELGLAHLGQGDRPRARNAFRRALEINPRYAAAHAELGMMEVFGGKPAAAVPHLKTVLDLDPTRADMHCLLGESRFAMGDPAESARAYRAALELNPRYVSAMLGLAKVHVNQRHDQEARDVFRRIQEIAPGQPLPRGPGSPAPEFEKAGL